MPYIITAELCKALNLNPKEVIAHWVKPEDCSPELYSKLCRIITETGALVVPEQEFEPFVKETKDDAILS